jgi:hypothetical protein
MLWVRSTVTPVYLQLCLSWTLTAAVRPVSLAAGLGIVQTMERDTARPRRRTRPLRAAALGVVPGLGHVYAGNWRKGLVLLGAFVGVEVLGLDLDLSVIGAAVGMPLELGGFGLWAYSMWDAYHSARRVDEAAPNGG